MAVVGWCMYLIRVGRWDFNLKDTIGQDIEDGTGVRGLQKRAPGDEVELGAGFWW